MKRNRLVHGTSRTRDRCDHRWLQLIRRGGTVAVCLAIGLAFAGSGFAAWQGSEVTRDGALHVMNPAVPMNGSAEIELEELWRIGGDTDNEDEFFGLISRMTTDEEGNVYILDTQLSEVKAFSPDGEYLRTLGREGEGPGEFRIPTGLFFVPGGNLGVLQAAPPKIVLLTKQGDPAGEFPQPQLAGEGFVALNGGNYAGDRLALFATVRRFDQETQVFTQNLILTAVDAEGKELARYHEEDRKIEFSKPVLREQDWDTIQNRWAVGADGKVYCAPTFEGYQIHCWNPDGSVDRIIEREHTTYKRSAKDIEDRTNLYRAFTRQVPGAEFEMSDSDKDIVSFYVRDDGTIWVLPSPAARAADESTVGTFDVFDAKGRFVQQVTLKGQGDTMEDGYFFVGDRIYVVTQWLQAVLAMQGGGEEVEEDEDAEPMAVICYRIDDSKLALD